MAANYPELFKKADNFRNGGKTDQAVALYNDIASLAAQDQHLNQAARALHMAGNTLKPTVTIHRQAVYQLSVQYFSKALGLFQQIGDDVGAGGVLRDLGVAADRAGDSNHALSSFQKSIELLSSHNEAAGELAMTYDKLGLHFARLGQYETALNYIDKALSTFRLSPESGFYGATTLFDQARVLYKMKEYERALDVATEALSWFEADHAGENYDRRLAQLHGLIGLIHEQRGETRAANQSIKEFNRLLKRFDIETADSLRHDLDRLIKGS